MDVHTIGRTIYKDLKLALKYIPDEKFQYNPGECFRAVLIFNGNGTAVIGNTRLVFNSPCVFCLTENEKVILDPCNNVSAHSLCFHPGIINRIFDFHNIIDPVSIPFGTDYNDLYWLQPFIKRTQDYKGLLSTDLSTLQSILQLFDKIKTELEEQRDYEWPCRSRSYFFELLFLLHRIYSLSWKRADNLVATRNSDEMDKVVLYLNTNYHNKINVAKLANLFNLNRTSLEKRFRTATGLSVINYLIKLRIELASILLRDTQLSVSEILERVGFNDRAHFSRLFGKNVGCTPSEYRRRYCRM